MFLVLQAGCISISRKRVVPQEERPLPVQTLSREQLLRSLEERSKQIQTLQGTVALDASGGGVTSGVLTEYRQTKGYIVVNRPVNIRVKVQAPLALATVIDMVSDGRQYRASIPVKNKFIIGDANAPPKDKNPILNLRPQHILDALFVDVGPYLKNSKIRSVLEETREGRHSFYVVSFIDVSGRDAELLEKFWVDRTDLQITRKQIFGEDGKLEADVEYSGYQSQGNIPYPQVIFIRRPVEEIMLKITFQKTTINEKLVTNAFDLERPAGAELVQLEPDAGGRKHPF